MNRNLLLLWLSFQIASCKGQAKDAINDIANSGILSQEQSSIIYEKVKKFPNETHLSIALIHQGVTQLVDIKRESDTLRVITSKDYVFEIGSVSKVFTSTLLADAVVKGELNLEDTIPLNLKDDIAISYKQLANHTSGLPRLPKNLIALPCFRTDNPYKDYHEELLENYLQKELVLDQPPGEKSSYSNLGAGLLGHLLAKNNSITYGKLIKDRIFSKYDMTISTMEKHEVKEFLVPGRNAKGQITSNWDLASLQGAGGIVSTSADLASFVNAHFFEDDEVLALSRKRTFRINDKVSMALGWHIIHTKSGENWHWHNGGTGGYSSSLAMDVDKKKAVIILSNLSAFHKLNKNIDPLCFDLMNTLNKE